MSPWITYTTLLGSATALLCAIGACVVALRSLRLSRASSSSKLSVRLTEIESTIEALSIAHRNLRSRLNMQSARAKARESEPIDDNPASVRAELNSQLALGRLKVTP